MKKSALFRQMLKEKELKITPQRMAVIEALYALKGHPRAEAVCRFVQQHHPNISTGTIYKTLEIFSEKQMIKKVKTDRDVMRFDTITEDHHHLYCEDTDRIEDYYDEELDRIIKNYFRKNKIPNFNMKDFKLQITGNFNDALTDIVEK